jgi:acetyl-CoA carboxylase carboxyltransferase component
MESLISKIENLKFIASYSSCEKLDDLINLNSNLISIEEQLDRFDLFLENEYEALNGKTRLLESLNAQNQKLNLLVNRLARENNTEPEPKQPTETPKEINKPQKPKESIKAIKEISIEEFQSLSSYIGKQNLTSWKNVTG